MEGTGTFAQGLSAWAVVAASLAIATLAPGCGGSSSGPSASDGGAADATTSANDGGGATSEGGPSVESDAAADANAGDGTDASHGGGADAASDGSTLDAAGDGAPDAGHGVDAGPDASGDAGLLACSNASATTTADAGAAPGVVAGMVAGPGTFIGGCQIFPANNAWNVDVSSTSIAKTTAYTGIPQGTHLHPDFGGWSPDAGTYGIPYNVVPHAQADVSITFDQYGTESDPGPGGWITNPNAGDAGVTAYPIPNSAKIEGDPARGQIAGDDHLLVLEQGAACGAPCTLWETWQTVGGSAPPWTAANGATWDLASNALRPLGWTSADAAGLSVFAGLVKFDEVAAGVVTHAIRVTFNDTQAGYVPPATHFGGTSPLGGAEPPMGLRLRLKASFSTSGFSGPGQIIAQAMKTYGLVVADVGSDWYFQGDSDDRWNDHDVSDTYIGELLTDFDRVTGADFEVLSTGTPSNTGE
jgi:hypothetical protein